MFPAVAAAWARTAANATLLMALADLQQCIISVAMIEAYRRDRLGDAEEDKKTLEFRCAQELHSELQGVDQPRDGDTVSTYVEGWEKIKFIVDHAGAGMTGQPWQSTGPTSLALLSKSGSLHETMPKAPRN